MSIDDALLELRRLDDLADQDTPLHRLDARAKDLGGPVLIYQIMSQARQMGWNWLLEMTAFISINLCVFNLLPMPVLDGGQLLFLAIEGVRRKPLDMRVLERVQQMGLVVIVLLILFVTFNDISRIVTNMVP